MRVTICEHGPRDGEIIDIPDGAHSHKIVRRKAPAILFEADPAVIDLTPVREVVTYTVERYRHPEQHDTPFALVSPEFKRGVYGV